MASIFSHRKLSMICSIHMSFMMAASPSPSSMPQPPKRYAFSFAQASVWPLRALGLPALLGFSFGENHAISPDLASFVATMMAAASSCAVSFKVGCVSCLQFYFFCRRDRECQLLFCEPAVTAAVPPKKQSFWFKIG